MSDQHYEQFLYQYPQEKPWNPPGTPAADITINKVTLGKLKEQQALLAAQLYNPCPEGSETAKLMVQHAEILRLREELSMAESTADLRGEIRRLEETNRKLRESERAGAGLIASHGEMYREEAKALREGLVAAWRILRAVEPEMFRSLDTGETFGDFASRLPKGTERAVIAALHASLKEGV